jgi:hypothetical protein
MSKWGLDSADVYGAVVVINSAETAFNVAVPDDFHVFRPILTDDELTDLTGGDRSG